MNLPQKQSSLKRAQIKYVGPSTILRYNNKNQTNEIIFSISFIKMVSLVIVTKASASASLLKLSENAF